ncbi:hypothetical protein FGF1_20170 [Flavobacteriaceae bacterium GF1]
MDFNDAAKRLIWRFQNFDTIRVNESDILAINKMVDFINLRQKQDFANHKYLINLYAFLLGYFIKKYNTTISNPLPHSELHKLMKRPLDHIIKEIAEDMNFRLKYQLLENAGVRLGTHPSLLTEEEKENNVKNIGKLLELGNNYNFFFQDAWSPKEIKEGVFHQIQNLLYGVQKSDKNTGK